MDPTTVAALIAACASLLVAIISSKKSSKSAEDIETLRYILNKDTETVKNDLSKDIEALKHNLNLDNEKFKHNLNKDIEAFKHSLILEREAMEEKKKRNNEQLVALSDSVKSMQKVKDVIQQIVDSYEKSHHSEVAIKNITTASKELQSSYEENFTELVMGSHPNEQKLFHKAKNLVFHIKSFVVSALDQKIYTSDLSTEDKNRLRAWRSELSEIQTQLQNSLYDKFIKCSMKNVGCSHNFTDKQATK